MAQEGRPHAFEGVHRYGGGALVTCNVCVCAWTFVHVNACAYKWQNAWCNQLDNEVDVSPAVFMSITLLIITASTKRRTP
jgi:hypothetical protein